ncbi:L-threonylcarbamoyladenylate synthase [Nonomuraea sp. NPDC003754]
MSGPPAILAADQLDQAAAALAAGHLVAVPTPRWYMLCAAAGNPAACEAIFTAKQRPASKPLLLAIDDRAGAVNLFRLGDAARVLIDQFWPGELALLLPWRDPDIRAAYPLIGAPALVQCPDGILGQLARHAGPITAASLSTSTPAAAGEEWPALTAGQAAAFIAATGAPVAAIIDGGICPHAHHLTIVDCTTVTTDDGQALGARIVREGTVHRRAIAAALRPALVQPGGDHHVV